MKIFDPLRTNSSPFSTAVQVPVPGTVLVAGDEREGAQAAAGGHVAEVLLAPSRGADV